MLKKAMGEVTNPIPIESLESECKKAHTILSGFATPVKHQPDKFIPPFVIQRARGLAVLSVIKGGFVFSGRVGAGVVIARAEDGGWSAPAAIGTAGVGWGFQAGAELADFVIILNTKDAVKAFSHGNVTLGGNLSVAAGPIGRNAEASAAVTLAAVFSYSRTRGLFAGISLEGSVIAERKDANKKFYGEHVTSRAILSGAIARPAAARDLYDLLARIDHNEHKGDHHSHSHSHSHGHPSSTPGGFPGAPPPGGHYGDPHGGYDHNGGYREAPPGGYGGPPPPGGYDNNGYHDHHYDEGGYREGPPGGYGGPPPPEGYQPQQSYGGPQGGPPGGYGGPPPSQPPPSYGGPGPQGSYRDGPQAGPGGPGGPPPLQQQGSFHGGVPVLPPPSQRGGGSGFGPPGQQQPHPSYGAPPQGGLGGSGGPGGPGGPVPQGSYRDAPSGNFGGPQGGPGPQGGYQQPQQSFGGHGGPPGPQGFQQPHQGFGGPGGPGPQGFQQPQSFGGPPGGNGGPPPMQQGGYPQRDMGPGPGHQPPLSQGGGPIGQAKGLYNFDAADETELSFKFDDVIVVWKQHGDWWEGEINGRRGLVPANYVELIH